MPNRHTHSDLCAIAVKWLKKLISNGGAGCDFAVSESRTGDRGETPDAIGFRVKKGLTGSVLVEAKTSRADFLADKKKSYRIHPEEGVGNWRYFIAPKDLISINELPDKWGLIEVNARGHARAVHGTHALKSFDEREKNELLFRFNHVNEDAERFLLVRTIANAGDPQVVLDRVRDAQRTTAQLNRILLDLRNEVGLSTYSSIGSIKDKVSWLVQRVEELESAQRFAKDAKDLIAIPRQP